MIRIYQSILLALLVAGGSQASLITYQFNVSTASLQFSQGYLDFQFNPGTPTPSDPASTILFRLHERWPLDRRPRRYWRCHWRAVAWYSDDQQHRRA